MLPILADDLIAFSVALSLCGAASALGAFLGGFVRNPSQPRGRVRPIVLGASVAAALLVVVGVSVLWSVGDDAVELGLTDLWLTPNETNQGAIGQAWSRLISLVIVLMVAGVAFAVASISAYLQGADRKTGTRPPKVPTLRWKLSRMLLLVLAASIACGAWTSARRKSLVFERARSAAEARWSPYGLEALLTRDGRIYELRSSAGGAVSPITANVVREIASLRTVNHLDLSRHLLPNEGLGDLRGAPQLHILDLSGSDVTDDLLLDLAQLDLRILYLNDTSITDAGLLQLAPLVAPSSPADEKGRRVSLHVHNTGVTPAGIAKLKALGEAAGGKWFVNTEPRSSRRR
ncbi:hypothetical protein Pla175_28680 [Pirellulimonas nuda]|uniref:Leucine Rich repeats (2 copies) n=1 Tax=Pirellulimonas nuda TaxID=2528009 RepID=A0A518DDD0_9BACT|nr:hypothetical protein [Pirellulimonas nuda]QDU89478.1 hypothetical protein Pla175_28680 [Pirellulimonas nuda]